mgnify:CR=1 FL=1
MGMNKQAAINQEKASSYLARFSSSTLGHFINGDNNQGTSSETFENHTPVDNSLLGKVAAGAAGRCVEGVDR